MREETAVAGVADLRAPCFGAAMVLLAWVVASCGVASDERSGGYGGGAPAAPGAGPAAAADPGGAAGRGLMAALLQARQRDAGPSYALEPDPTGEDGILAVGRSAQQQLGLRFRSEGVEIEIETSGDWVGLSLIEVGRGAAFDAAPGLATEPSIAGNEARYERGAELDEWYLNGPVGLEQGFVMGAPPAGSGGPVGLVVALGGTLVPELAAGEVLLRDAAARVRARYGLLHVTDAEGDELPSWMELDGDAVVLRFSDEAASYPVTIDPFVWTEEQKLLAGDMATDDGFGGSVSLSSDGSRALVGAPQEDSDGLTDNGAAYVFLRSGGSWTVEQKLLAADKAQIDFFGSSVSLSSDGSRALVGAHGEDSNGLYGNGAAYVFVRSGSTWTEEQKLLATDGASAEYFGGSVSLSADGSRALVGASREASDGLTDNGAAYVFVRSDGSWTEEQKLLASDKAGSDIFGYSVSLSSDGSRALVGARGDDSDGLTNNGAAYVFVRSDGSWTEEQKLLASDKESYEAFGNSVSLSSDGSRALVGAPEEDPDGVANNGAAYVFVRSGGSWTEEHKLLASDAASDDSFGFSVSLSSDGNRALAGSADDSDGLTANGAAYVFVRSGGSWTEEHKLLASDKASWELFGASVALSADGSRALVGAWGAAYAFAFLATSGTVCGSDGECLSGFCSDGVCCESLCDGSCEQCGASDGEGTCTPVAAGTECHASAGECDAVEVCDGASGTCPDDVTDPDGTACSEGVCQSGICEPEGTGGSGGTPSTGGGGGGSTPAQQDSGCGCRIAGAPREADSAGWLALLGLAVVRARRRRTQNGAWIPTISIAPRPL